MGDFDTKQAEQRVGTIMGDCLGHYRKHLSGQTAIAFCCSVAHAEAVAGLFQSAGIAAASDRWHHGRQLHGASYWQT
jgi:DNA repair protein RadD